MFLKYVQINQYLNIKYSELNLGIKLDIDFNNKIRKIILFRNLISNII